MENRELTYTKFWQDNLEKISLVQKDLDRSLNQLEKEYVCFEEVYRELEEDLDLLSSLYAGLNTIEGMEYLQKLRAMIHNYKGLYTREGIDFETLNFLTMKISELRDISFEDFPLLEHIDQEKSTPPPPGETSGYDDKPFKWITFQRNCSWFITCFNTLKIIDAEVTSCSFHKEQNIIEVSVEDRSLEALDIFGEFTSPPNNPKYFIEIDNERAYAADTLGKRIYSAHDIVSGKITPFNRVAHSSIASGRVRLFGRQHLFINQE